MTNNSIQQTPAAAKIATMQPVAIPRLSDDAYYLLVLASRLKKMLGPASLLHFLATGEAEVFAEKAS